MLKNNSSIDIIKNTILQIVPNSSIVLFGSHARNDNDQLSDFDLLVVSDEAFDIQMKRSFRSRIRKELAKFKIPVDVIIQSQDEINTKKEIQRHIVREAIKEGFLI